MSNAHRTALETAATALGYENATEANDGDLQAFLNQHSGRDHEPDGGGNTPQGEQVREGRHTGGDTIRAATYEQLPDDKSIELTDGDLVITVPDDQLMRVTVTAAEDDQVGPTVGLIDGHGAQQGFPHPFRPGIDYVNTGLKVGDLVRTHNDQDSDDARSVPYLRITGFDSETHHLQGRNVTSVIGWKRDSNDGDLMNFGLRASTADDEPPAQVRLQDVVGHWPLTEGRQLEFTQEAVNHFARINALLHDQPFTISEEPVVLVHRSSGGSNSLRANVRNEPNNPVLRSAADWFQPDNFNMLLVSAPHEGTRERLLTALAENVTDEVRGYDPSNLSRILQCLPFDLTEPIYELVDIDLDALQQQDADGQPFDPSRATLADLKNTKPPAKRQANVVPDDKVRELVDEAMGDSDKVRDALTAALEGNREAFREALGVPEDLDTLGQKMIDDVEKAFERLKADQDRWRERTEEKMTRVIEFRQPDMPTISVENAHERLPSLLFNAKLRKHTLLVGPSGAGKTTASRMTADALGLDFGYIALGPTQTETKFSGYTDAHGVYVPTEFYLRYRYGGVFLMDEMDAGHPAALTWINGALANGLASFPRGLMSEWERREYHPDEDPGVPTGGMIPMHPDFVAIGSANTFGKGADLVYQGRNALDGATLKRFKVIYWDYDERLERALAGDDVWVDFVQALRASARHLDMHHIVSPVDAIDGALMIQAGKPWNVVAHETALAGLTQADRTKLLNPQGAQNIKRQIARAHQALTEREANEDHLGTFLQGATQ